jgi:hypothetical protein
LALEKEAVVDAPYAVAQLQQVHKVGGGQQL